ncbi:MAG: hypothetical protein QME66_05550 [Candidatus Eisenbacteria bacterium]|nr:hypothetical protein [Candidatus Eisenbacteria bacterium]
MAENLPTDIQERLDAYIERVKKIPWFQPKKGWKKSEATKLVKITLRAFGVDAKIEYRKLESPDDWAGAWTATWDAARDAAWTAARDAAQDAAWGAAWGAARDAALGSQEIIVSDLTEFRSKYKNGAFLLLIPLWEMGLYPIGICDGKFVIYVPKA